MSHARMSVSARQWTSAALLLLSSGCVELPRPAQEQLSQAETDYRERRYPAAQTKLDGVISDYPSYRQAAEAYYLRAMCRIAQSNKAGASADIAKCLELATSADLTRRAHATAAELDYEAGRYKDAQRHFEQALSRSGERKLEQQDLLHLRYGMCLQRLGEWQAARMQFAMAMQRSPGGTVATQARAMADWPNDYFVIQCGVFRDAAAAAKRAAELQRMGLPAKVEVRSRAGQTIQTVCVGNYSTFEQAQKALPGVKGKAAGAVIFPN